MERPRRSQGGSQQKPCLLLQAGGQGPRLILPLPASPEKGERPVPSWSGIFLSCGMRKALAGGQEAQDRPLPKPWEKERPPSRQARSSRAEPGPGSPAFSPGAALSAISPKTSP